MLNLQSLFRGRFNPIRAMIFCVLVTLAIFAVLGYNLNGIYTSFNKLVDVDFKLTRLTGKVVYLDELLTMSARLAVTTGDLRWQKRWNENLEPIDKAIKEANTIDQTAFQTEGAEQTQKANDRLAELETQAMDTLNNGNKKAAYDIMFSREYEDNKKLHKGGMEKINESIDQRLARQIQEVNRQLVAIAMLLAVSLGLMMLAWVGVIYLVKKHESQQEKIIESERKAKEAQEAVVKQLKEMDKLKDNFLANTSHELRTPLNGIIGLAESMVDGATGPITDVQRENLDMIVSSGRRLSNLVNDILDFSKLKHKDIELQLKPVDMRSLAAVVLQFSRSLVAGKKLALVNSIEPGTPSVLGDENRLQQILINLVGNAIKFSEEGKVEITARQNGAMLEVSIHDTGIGIPADKFDRIFESFEQADGSTARQYGGTGIGLAITRKMVELHKGTIAVQSTVGKGSVFTFSIPVSGEPAAAAPPAKVQHVEAEPEDLLPELVPAESAAPAPADAAKSEEQAEEEKDNSQTSVLIVDDEPVNLQVLANHLSLYGYHVEKAASGVEAAERINRGERFDLILLDVMMPRMSGYELCQIVREKFPASELPIVLLTAKNQTQDLVTGFESGANDYLTKPVNKQELMARVKMHLLISRVNAAFGRFVPKEFLSILGHENIVEVQLGEQIMRTMSILFSDIRSFTTLSEGMTPKDNFDFINSYLGRLGPVIRNHRGFIDKYIGDAIMALFPEKADDSVSAAIGMFEELKSYNARRKDLGRPPIKIGVGIHTGNLMLGTVGEAKRMEGTVISDSVNLASRLESLTKKFGVQAIISESTLQGLSDPSSIHSRFLGKVKVKGKTKWVPVYELLDGMEPGIVEKRLASRAVFEQGVQLFFAKHFADAAAYFEKAAQIDPGDIPAKLYLDKSQSQVLSNLVA